ncbi:uncharacterized protein LOC134268511 [Saccostrea cucullata]|uniref:uncharacterized protein LOC134268511 n=1 Tax=Saccostrea cuccullata TaxID=36930 RepID=UPI002ED5D1F5
MCILLLFLEAESARNKIASLLLEHGCSVNKPNTYGETPLTNVIKRMTDLEGTNSMEIDHSETATVAKFDLSLFNRLICSGAKIDPVVKTTRYYGSISTLSNLLRNGFFGAAASLLKCGYNCKNDKDLQNVDFSNLENSIIFVKGKPYKRINYEQEKNEFLNVLKKHEEKEAISLLSLCRTAIRMKLIDAGQGAEIESKIKVLPVPGLIKTYLTLREHMQDFEQMQLKERYKNKI